MDSNELKLLLDAVSQGRTSPDDALKHMRWRAPFEKMGEFATVDTHRKLRCGFPEVIFGQGKTPEHIVAILRRLETHGEGGLATRLSAEAVAILKSEFPHGEHNALGRTFRVRGTIDPGPKVGRVVIVTGGTADLPVAEEARVTAEAWNCHVQMMADVGVAGIHRLLNRIDELHGADVIVAVAGMEAALPSVVGGLVDCPVIAVPTSVGYGAHFGGLAALLGVLNSCASNVVAVNIDAGFNGGHVGGLIARRAGQARGEGSPDEKA
jgi:NCAIR mutase (PurE)-related protein